MTEETRAAVQALLDEAARVRKPCGYADYERMKLRLIACALTDVEYSREIRRLCDALEV